MNRPVASRRISSEDLGSHLSPSRRISSEDLGENTSKAAKKSKASAVTITESCTESNCQLVRVSTAVHTAVPMYRQFFLIFFYNSTLPECVRDTIIIRTSVSRVPETKFRYRYKGVTCDFTRDIRVLIRILDQI